MLQKKYSKSQEQNLVSFDYVDFANGIGLSNFYLTVSKTSGSTIYSLYGFAIPSADNYLTSNTDYTFSTSIFNLPKYIVGTAVFMLSARTTNSTHVKFKIQKWDGTTATDLSDDIEWNYTPVGTVYNNNHLLEIPIIYPQTIKKGEQIRLVCDYIAGSEFRITADPTGALDWGDVDTASRILFPFKIDI